MHGSTELFPIRPLAPPRRLILGTALALALVVWLAPRTPVAAAQETQPAAGVAATTAPPAAPLAGDNSGAGTNNAAKAASEASMQGRADVAVKTEKDPATGQRTITVTKDGKTVTVTGASGDKEFDSFDEFVHKEPGLAFGVVAVVAVVFLSPVLAIALILAYRMRKARMQNETLLKLAERGVVPPAEAMAAVATGTLPPQVAAASSAGMAVGAATPLENARTIRKQAAWSDLRKGVVMGAIGLGLTLYSLVEERSANGIGLVLLFVGIGYVVLWWFEERQIAPHDGGGTPPGSGPGSAL